jgi:small-conductance mechanosensitive channel
MNKLLFFKLKSFFTILFLIGYISSFSQNTEPLIKKDSTKTSKPQAIPLVNIIQQLEIISDKIKGIDKKTALDPTIAKIDSLLPNYEEHLRVELKNSESFITANPNRPKINNLLNKWFRTSDYLQSWETTINNAIQKNTTILTNLAVDENVWELTYKNIKENDIPREVIKRVDDIRIKLFDVKSSIITENNNYLLLESKINLQLALVEDLIQRLQDLKSSAVYDLFYLRHQPLWKTSFKSANPDKKIIEEDSTLDKEDYNSAVEFIKEFENRIYLFIIITLAIILFFRYLKNGFALYEINTTNENIVTAKDIIYNKYIVTTLFTFLVIAKLYFTNSPRQFDDILTLCILIASLPIVYKRINEKFKNSVYVIILFYILETIKTYVWFESYQYRLYLLFEALIVIGSLYYFTKPYLKTRKINVSRFSLFIIRLTPAIYFLAIVSIISNILGYTNLTDVTLKICTQGSVLSIVFYVILLVSQAILFALLHRHYANKTNYDLLKVKSAEKKLIIVIRFAVFILWLIFFLKIIDQFDPVLSLIDSILEEPYVFGTITITIGAILSFLTILILSFLITSLISFIFDDGQDALRFLNLPKGIPAAISLVIRYIIIAAGIVLALSSLGVDLSKFNLMAGALGLGIGFGLQNVIANFVSGLILVFERPILPGDTVEVNNLMGTVKKIGVRSSKVSTFDGAEVVVPNTNLISNDLINWTLSNNIKRVEILIGTGYDSDPNQVLELLLECANNYTHLVKDPPPVALFSDFGDSSLNFRLRFWVHFEIGLQAKSDVSIDIYNKFKEHHIEIPFPQQDLHIKDVPNKNED